ncbi:hypothetical protein BJX63DRAFT_133502 [Aspergillus granulosus]|uniref:Uncharacterized protein n=1 Tax=Aspergillus granulosus TaxID=176169 RepID=A0ABR4GSV6_9EURO
MNPTQLDLDKIYSLFTWHIFFYIIHIHYTRSRTSLAHSQISRRFGNGKYIHTTNTHISFYKRRRIPRKKYRRKPHTNYYYLSELDTRATDKQVPVGKKKNTRNRGDAKQGDVSISSHACIKQSKRADVRMNACPYISLMLILSNVVVVVLLYNR